MNDQYVSAKDDEVLAKVSVSMALALLIHHKDLSNPDINPKDAGDSAALTFMQLLDRSGYQITPK